jgi:hypothetical protein
MTDDAQVVSLAAWVEWKARRQLADKHLPAIRAELERQRRGEGTTALPAPAPRREHDDAQLELPL